MDRKEFFSALGYSSGVMMIAGCLGACKKSQVTYDTPAPTVDFTLDINQGLNIALKNPGGYVYSNNVIVAKTTSGDIIAVAQFCPHQGTSVQYQGDRNRFYCPNHGQLFTNTGAFIEGPTNKPLKQYTVVVTGDLVHVTG